MREGEKILILQEELPICNPWCILYFLEVVYPLYDADKDPLAGYRLTTYHSATTTNLFIQLRSEKNH
jgi:hypothetical protein